MKKVTQGETDVAGSIRSEAINSIGIRRGCDALD
jgi:hypothetical protein